MKKNNENYLKGHIAALITILIWGLTFVSTKILLQYFMPVEILFIRFIIGYLALCIICPKYFKFFLPKREKFFALAGFLGICLYYLLENIALKYTLASNCGVIMSVTPFVTAILSRFFTKSKVKLTKYFIIGFIIAMAGISLICLNGAKFELNPLGDILALCATVVWGLYSIVSKKIAGFHYPLIVSIRKTFFYGILFIIPAIFLFGADLNLLSLANPIVSCNILFLGLGASALCFMTWNYALKNIGVVKTSVYLYLVPVLTVVSAAIILREQFTPYIILGTFLTILGLFISKK